MNAGCAGGSSRRPVLFTEALIGFFGSFGASGVSLE